MAVHQEPMGVWGVRTASIDWCETNYEHTPWIAEFWNTLSNISMIIPPIFGIYNAITQDIERRYIVSHLFFLLVGIGSTMFHMTLQYSMQLLDELPMIYTTCIFIYCQALVKSGPGTHNPLLLALLALYAFSFTLIYAVWSNPLIHENMYGLLIFILLFQSCKLLYDHYDPASMKMFVVGTGMYAVAFLIWNIDNHYCPQLQDFRAASSPSVGALSQLHAWWHILAGYSTYLHILFSTHYRLLLLRRHPRYVICPIGINVVKAV